MPVERKVNGMGIFARAGDLDKSVEHFPATNDPGQAGHLKLIVKVGVVRYRRCVTVSIGSEELLLWLRPPLGRRLFWDAPRRPRVLPPSGRPYGQLHGAM